MKFKNVIFDWSGVVKDATESHVWVINKMIEKFGGSRQMTLFELRENWEQPYMRFWNKIYPELTLEKEQQLYREVILDNSCPECGPYEGIVEVIKNLKEKRGFNGGAQLGFARYGFTGNKKLWIGKYFWRSCRKCS